MILSEVRTTIRDVMITLDYDEWTGYTSDDLPETLLEKSFHVGVSGGSAGDINQHTLNVESDVILTLWRKGFNTPVEAMDAGLSSIQTVLCALLNPVTRTLPAYRKIDFNGYELSQITSDNDSICKIIINLKVDCILEVTQTTT